MSRKFARRSVGLTMVGLAVAAVAVFGGSAGAQSRSLGRAESFAVLAGATVTDTPGPSVITGDLGVFPGTAITGNPQVNGEIHAGDAVAGGAQTDARAAHTTLGGLPCTQTLPGIVGNLTLTPGVYCFTSDALLTGTLTLDFEDDPNAEFIFKVGTALTTASGSMVALTRSPNACNVFWQVGSSAVLGTNSVFIGTILAGQSITAATGARITGRLLALVGQVSLDNNTVNRPTCAVVTTSSSTSPPTSSSSTTLPTSSSTSSSSTPLPTSSTSSSTTSTSSSTTSSTSTSSTTSSTSSSTSSSSTPPSTATSSSTTLSDVSSSSSTTLSTSPSSSISGPATDGTSSAGGTSTGAGGTTDAASNASLSSTGIVTSGGGGDGATAAISGGARATTSGGAGSQTLPRTGSSVRGWLLAGGLAVALGGLMVQLAAPTTPSRRRGPDGF